MTDKQLPLEDREPVPPAHPRRRLLRALTGAAVIGATLATLTACGGEDDDDDEDDD